MQEVDRIEEEFEMNENLDDLKNVKYILESDIETRILPNQGYPYIPASSLRDRLNEAFSLRWSTKVLSSEIIEDTVLVLLRLTVKIGDDVIIKEDFGSASLHRFTYGKNEGKYTNPGDGYSNAIFDALKSCSKALGIGNKQMDVYKNAQGKYVQHSQAPIKPAVAKPAVAKPAVAKPAVAKPAVAKPAVAKPAVAKPAVAKPAVAKPAVAKPAVVKESIDPKVMPVEPQLAPIETKQPEAYACPGGGTFGESNDSFPECDSCSVYNDCCKAFFNRNK